MSHDPTKAAVLTLTGSPPTSEAMVTIRYDSGTFILSELDREIARCEHPKPLERYAWANGAQTIRSEYDLRIAEELRP